MAAAATRRVPAPVVPLLLLQANSRRRLGARLLEEPQELVANLPLQPRHRHSHRMCRRRRRHGLLQEEQVLGEDVALQPCHGDTRWPAGAAEHAGAIGRRPLLRSRSGAPIAAGVERARRGKDTVRMICLGARGGYMMTIARGLDSCWSDSDSTSPPTMHGSQAVHVARAASTRFHAERGPIDAVSHACQDQRRGNERGRRRLRRGGRESGGRGRAWPEEAWSAPTAATATTSAGAGPRHHRGRVKTGLWRAKTLAVAEHWQADSAVQPTCGDALPRANATGARDPREEETGVERDKIKNSDVWTSPDLVDRDNS